MSTIASLCFTYSIEDASNMSNILRLDQTDTYNNLNLGCACFLARVEFRRRRGQPRSCARICPRILSGVSVEPQVHKLFWCFGVSGLRCCLNLINFQYVQPQKLLRQEKMAATDAAIKTQAGVGWRAGQVWHSRCRAHCAAMGSLQRYH